MYTTIFRIARALIIVAFVFGGVWLIAEQPKPISPTRFTVVDAGTAGKPDVILIPGLASSRAVWDAEAAKLAPNFRLHLVQVNGFAGQPAGTNTGSTDLLPGVVEELHGYIAASGMHPDVIGHSMGGLLALMLADRHPGDVRRMVIVDSLPFYSVLFNPAATAENSKPIAEGLKAQFSGMSADEFAAGTQKSAAAMVKSPEGLKLVTASSVASDRAVFAEAMAEDMTTDLRADVANIKTPTLVLYPYDSSAQGPDPAKVAALYEGQYKGMPNVKLVRVDDSRHFMMYDQPAKMDAEIQAFLR